MCQSKRLSRSCFKRICVSCLFLSLVFGFIWSSIPGYTGNKALWNIKVSSFSLRSHRYSRSRCPGPPSKERERENHSVLPPSVPDVIPASRGEITANLLFISNIPRSLCESWRVEEDGEGFQGHCVYVLCGGPWGNSLGVSGRALKDIWGMLRSF